MKKQEIFMIGNAHLDPAWVWSWQEGSCEAKATIRSALDRMKEFPDFKFVCSSSSVYQWIEDFDPNMFEEMKQRIAEGRFIIVGGWKVQPDCNLPSGENFARNSLYSQRYFYENFGKMAKVGYNVDSFGHNAMMPQILQKSGMKYYVYMRPMEWEKSMKDNIFTWESPDGSRVTAFRINEEYCKNFTTMEGLETYLESCTKFYNGNEFMGYYGVGNHGGGPTITNIKLIQEYNEKADGKYHLNMADPVEFFEKYEAEHDLPVLKEELQHHASGCYSAVSEVKTLLRKGETKLGEAERFGVLADLLIGKKYNKEDIQKGWENLNFLTFHDILGGCCIKSAYDNSLYMGYEAISLAEKQKNSALQTLSWTIDTTDRSHGLPIVVFNPHAFEVEEVIEINHNASSLKDAEGNDVPFINVPSEPAPVFDRDNAIFTAKVPAMGYAVYYYTQSVYFNRPMTSDAYKGKNTDPMALENGHIAVRFSANGNIQSITDKRNGKEVLSGETQAVVIDETEHDTWSHSKNYFDKEIGRFAVTKMEKIESNEIREIIKVTATYGNSTLSQYYTLNAEEDFVRVRVKLNWNEKHKMLKLAFPIACETPTSIYEIPFGALERPCNGEEEPALMWAMVGDSAGGLAILNDSKYSYSAKENVLSLTAIRSPIYCDHGRVRNEESNYTDQGVHEFTYAILPANTGEKARIFRKALLLNTPLTSVLENHHKGSLPLVLQGINVGADNIVVSAVKVSEDGTGYVVRAYECEGIATETDIQVNGLPVLKASFGAYEVKTYFLKDGEWTEVLFTEYKE
ncbi:MAG: alpha-mannosidase [Clostridiales bacterium]|nr:alpha-mannosidase [Clostridiales bacterium]